MKLHLFYAVIDAAYEDESTNLLMQKYAGFQEKIHKGHLWKILDLAHG